jgi:hypothetical protein
MDDKTKPICFYITKKDNNYLDENIGNSNDVVNDNPQSIEERMQLLVIMGTTNVHDVGDHNLNGIKEQGLKFYVEQSRNEAELSTIGTSYQANGRAINLANFTQVLEYEVPHFHGSIAPTPFHLAHLLSLPNLHARKIRRIKLLVDYNKSHIMTTIEYLEIMQQNVTKEKL